MANLVSLLHPIPYLHRIHAAMILSIRFSCTQVKQFNSNSHYYYCNCCLDSLDSLRWYHTLVDFIIIASSSDSTLVKEAFLNMAKINSIDFVRGTSGS